MNAEEDDPCEIVIMDSSLLNVDVKVPAEDALLVVELLLELAVVELKRLSRATESALRESQV